MNQLYRLCRTERAWRKGVPECRRLISAMIAISAVVASSSVAFAQNGTAWSAKVMSLRPLLPFDAQDLSGFGI